MKKPRSVGQYRTRPIVPQAVLPPLRYPFRNQMQVSSYGDADDALASSVRKGTSAAPSCSCMGGPPAASKYQAPSRVESMTARKLNLTGDQNTDLSSVGASTDVSAYIGRDGLQARRRDRKEFAFYFQPVPALGTLDKSISGVTANLSNGSPAGDRSGSMIKRLRR